MLFNFTNQILNEFNLGIVYLVLTGSFALLYFSMSAGFSTEGQVAYAISAIAWIYVGHCWNDKAIMIGSAITGTSVLMNLVEVLIGS